MPEDVSTTFLKLKKNKENFGSIIFEVIKATQKRPMGQKLGIRVWKKIKHPLLVKTSMKVNLFDFNIILDISILNLVKTWIRHKKKKFERITYRLKTSILNLPLNESPPFWLQHNIQHFHVWQLSLLAGDQFQYFRQIKHGTEDGFSQRALGKSPHVYFKTFTRHYNPNLFNPKSQPRHIRAFRAVGALPNYYVPPGFSDLPPALYINNELFIPR